VRVPVGLVRPQFEAVLLHLFGRCRRRDGGDAGLAADVGEHVDACPDDHRQGKERPEPRGPGRFVLRSHRGSAVVVERDALRLGELLEGLPAFLDAVGVPEELVLLDAAIAARRNSQGC